MAKSMLLDNTCIVHEQEEELEFVRNILCKCRYKVGYSKKLDHGEYSECYYLQGSDGMMHSGYMTWNEMRHFAAGMSRAQWYYGK